MRYLKRFESLSEGSPNWQWEHLAEIYLYICDLLQDLKDDGIKITIHTNKYIWGEIDREKVNLFIIFCQQFTNYGHYYLKIDLESNSAINDYMLKYDKLPDGVVQSIDSTVDYLKSEGFETKIEAMTVMWLTDIPVGSKKGYIVVDNLGDLVIRNFRLLSLFIIFKK